jgi:hypothetical protein
MHCAARIASLLRERVRGERPTDISLPLEKVSQSCGVDWMAALLRPPKGGEREKWVAPLH